MSAEAQIETFDPFNSLVDIHIWDDDSNPGAAVLETEILKIEKLPRHPREFNIKAIGTLQPDDGSEQKYQILVKGSGTLELGAEPFFEVLFPAEVRGR